MNYREKLIYNAARSIVTWLESGARMTHESDEPYIDDEGGLKNVMIDGRINIIAMVEEMALGVALGSIDAFAAKDMRIKELEGRIEALKAEHADYIRRLNMRNEVT